MSTNYNKVTHIDTSLGIIGDAPLDARGYVQYTSDLTTLFNDSPYRAYYGMEVIVGTSGASTKYRYTNSSYSNSWDISNWMKVDIADAMTESKGGTTSQPLRSTGPIVDDDSVMTHGKYRDDVVIEGYGAPYNVRKEFDTDAEIHGFGMSSKMLVFYSGTAAKVYIHNLITNKKYVYKHTLMTTNMKLAVVGESAYIQKIDATKNAYGIYITDGGKTIVRRALTSAVGDFKNIHATDGYFYTLGTTGWARVEPDTFTIKYQSFTNSDRDVFIQSGAFCLGINSTTKGITVWRANKYTTHAEEVYSGNHSYFTGMNSVDDINFYANKDHAVVFGLPNDYLTTGKLNTFYIYDSNYNGIITTKSEYETNSNLKQFPTKTKFIPGLTSKDGGFVTAVNGGYNLIFNIRSKSITTYDTDGSYITVDESNLYNNSGDVLMQRSEFDSGIYYIVNKYSAPATRPLPTVFNINENKGSSRLIDSNEWDGGIDTVVGTEDYQAVLGRIGANSVIKLYESNGTITTLHTEVYNANLKLRTSDESIMYWWNSTHAYFKQLKPGSSIITTALAGIRDLQVGSRDANGLYAALIGDSTYLSRDGGVTFTSTFTVVDTYGIVLNNTSQLRILSKSDTKVGYIKVHMYNNRSGELKSADSNHKTTDIDNVDINFNKTYTFASPKAQNIALTTYVDSRNKLKTLKVNYARLSTGDFNASGAETRIYRGADGHISQLAEGWDMNSDILGYGNITLYNRGHDYRKDIVGFSDGPFLIQETDGFQSVRKVDIFGYTIGFLKNKVNSIHAISTLAPKIEIESNSNILLDNTGSLNITMIGSKIGSSVMLKIPSASGFTINGTLIGGIFNASNLNYVKVTCINELQDATSYEYEITSTAGGGGGGMFDTITDVVAWPGKKLYRNTEMDNTNQDSFGIGYDAMKNNEGRYGIGLGKDAGSCGKSTNTMGISIGYEAGMHSCAPHSIGIGYYGARNNKGDYSVGIGSNALDSNCGDFSVAIGKESLSRNIGTKNTAIGCGSSRNNCGNESTAVGNEANMQYNTAGRPITQGIVAVGNKAAYLNAGLCDVVMIGNNSGYSNKGCKAIGVGSCAMQYNCGANSVGIGVVAGSNGTGGAGVNIGYAAGYYANNGASVMIGMKSGEKADADHSVIMGTCSGMCSTICKTILIGYEAGHSSTATETIGIGSGAARCASGTNGTYVGRASGYNACGTNSLGLGYQAGSSNTGGRNISIGENSATGTSGDYNIAIGTYTGINNAGSNNIAIGCGALSYSRGTGINTSIGLGINTLKYSSGGDVISMGTCSAGLWNASCKSIMINGTNRVGIQHVLATPPLAGPNNVFYITNHGWPTGTHTMTNVGVAGYGIAAGGTVTVNVENSQKFVVTDSLTRDNPVDGTVRLRIVEPLENIAIINPKPYESAWDANIPDITTSNEMHYGNKEMSKHVFYGDVECTGEFVGAGGGPTPTPTLQDVTDAGNSTTNNIVTTGTATALNFILSSDERLKTFKDESIVDVSSVDIKKFNYNNDETNRNRYGVSAQELQKIAPEMVYEDEEGLLSVGYTDFLLAKVNKQDKEIAELKILVLKLIEK